jgi:hypothetical protein
VLIWFIFPVLVSCTKKSLATPVVAAAAAVIFKISTREALIQVECKRPMKRIRLGSIFKASVEHNC